MVKIFNNNKESVGTNSNTTKDPNSKPVNGVSDLTPNTATSVIEPTLVSANTNNKNKEFKTLLMGHQLQIDDLTSTLQRLQAEFENYKKRTDKESIAHVKHANATLIRKLLPVLDTFDSAITNCKSTKADAQYIKGLELLHTQLLGVLSESGLRSIDTENKKFDPFKHEVMLVQECDKDDDLILSEFQKGYMLNENILRHSKVMIAKKISKDTVENK